MSSASGNPPPESPKAPLHDEEAAHGFDASTQLREFPSSTLTPDSGLQRRLEQRQMSMMALVGTFGTGLFLASGKVIATGGPAGALISYTLVGTVSYAMCQYPPHPR
jgi:amino acid permease